VFRISGRRHSGHERLVVDDISARAVTSSDVARACVLSSLLCVVLATRAVVGFDSARAKLISGGRTIPYAGVANVTIGAARASRLDPPFAVIARVRNESSARLALEIRVDNQPACNRTIPGDGAEHRIDCVWSGDWVPRVPHDVQVVGGISAPRW